MAWGGEWVRRVRTRRHPVRHPVLVMPTATLLAVAFLAGCGDPARRSAPTFHPPLAPTSTAGTAPATVDPGGDRSGEPTQPASPDRSPLASDAVTPRRYVFPVRGKASYHPTHAGYPATDIFAGCGTPVVAVTDGRILEVSRVDRYSKSGPQGPFNGGRSVSLLGDDGVRYYGSHLTEVAGGVEAGVRVRAGQQVGTVGRTGNANNVCHLHFGISPPCGGTDDWWIRRGVVWPAPYLDAWKKQDNRSPTDTVTAWHRKHGCPEKP